VTIEDEGKQYAVIRHRAHKEFKNRLIVRSEDGDLTKGKDTLTQELVERLIGSSKEVFMASIYASQEAMPDLPGMTDKNLKAIVEEAAGIDRLTKAYAIARDRANAMSARLTEQTHKPKAQCRLSLRQRQRLRPVQQQPRRGRERVPFVSTKHELKRL
jgi:DNA repair exonuclease SbcCD ATPase subunit